MTTQTPSEQSNAGDGLMALISAAVIFIVVLEAAFIAYASWLLLPLIMLGVIAAAIVVIVALTRVIDHDTPIPVSGPKPLAVDAGLGHEDSRVSRSGSARFPGGRRAGFAIE